jgi:O-acetyl-ADP-ribose deacetylase (regulator of RNase III)
MSFRVRYGDMFAEVKTGFIMHGCNAQGVMGSGVARIIKERYRKAYEVYAAQAPHYILGEVIPVTVADELVIINAITQNLFGVGQVHADYDAIRQSMKGAYHVVTSRLYDAPQELHMPFIGAGLGGGDPDTIIEIMRGVLEDAPFPATLWVYDAEHLVYLSDDDADELFLSGGAKPE